MSNVPDDIFALIEADESRLPIQIAVDPDGVPVFLSRAVWVEHILRRHPAMSHLRDLLLQAISSPVAQDIEDKDHVISFLAIPDDRQISVSQILRIRVVIKYVYPPERDFERTGLISTAFTAPNEG